LKNGDSAVPGTVAYALKKVLAANGDNSFQAEYTRVVQRSADSYTVLSNAMARNTVLAIPTTATSADGRSGALNQDPLAKQLRVVAQMIAANQTLGMKRQVFMVSIGGFDTHANQLADHATLSKRVALSTAYFQSAMQALGLFNNVTLFTASDFGRGLVSNGSGSDHGWGSHHFVAGGAVKGKDIYGRFPTLALGSNDDTGSGRMLPGTSVAEYAAPLARWMGLSETDIAAVLPSLSAFGSNNLAYI